MEVLQNKQNQFFEGNFTVFENEIWDLAEEFDLSNGAVVLYMKMKSMAFGKKKTIFPSQQKNCPQKIDFVCSVKLPLLITHF